MYRRVSGVPPLGLRTSDMYRQAESMNDAPGGHANHQYTGEGHREVIEHYVYISTNCRLYPRRMRKE